MIAGAFLCAGCSSTWSPTRETSVDSPQWRDDANKPRAAYLYAIKGFTETGFSFANIMKFAHEDLITKFLPVVDDLERSLPLRNQSIEDGERIGPLLYRLGERGEQVLVALLVNCIQGESDAQVWDFIFLRDGGGGVVTAAWLDRGQRLIVECVLLRVENSGCDR
jgi:hypothetical protein